MIMDYHRLETSEMLPGRRISVCFLAAIFSSLLVVPTCQGLVASYIVKRCWSDVENAVATTHKNASTTCFTTNSEEAICYELKTDVFTCKPPWEVVSVKDPATIDHLAVAMRKSTLPYFPARILGDIATDGFLNYFSNSSECSSKTVVDGAAIQNGTCALLRVKEVYYETQFLSESCQPFGSYTYACSKTLAIGGVGYSTTVQSLTPTSTLLQTGGMTTDSFLVTAGSVVGTLDTLHIILLAVSINLVVVVLIVSILCCCCKRTSKSALLSGSYRNSNRPLPIPDRSEVSEKYNQGDREYEYPTVTFFRTTDSNGPEKTNRAVERSASTPPKVPTRQYDTEDDMQYMHIGETVNEHQQALMQRQRQTKNRLVHSYLELEDIARTDENCQRPISHTYADLDNVAPRNEEEYHRPGGKFKQNDLDKPQSCYMGLSNVTRSNMDMSVYKGLWHGHLVPSGCTREGCEECESAHLNPNSRTEMGDHDSTSAAHGITTHTPQSPCYQQSLIMEPAFYMAVEGRSQGSCEIGDMAKCFEDNTYSFLK